MRKTIGDNNRKAGQAAVTSLAAMKGQNVKSLKDKEVKELLIAILQLLGLADAEGNIK